MSTPIPPDTLIRFSTDALLAAGVPPNVASLAADTLVDADLKGNHTHGVMRLTTYVQRLQAGVIERNATPLTLQETPALAVLDGRNMLGQPLAHAAMRAAIVKARDVGVGVATVRNANHFGAASYYSEMAAAEGMIGLAASNASAVIAAKNGREPAVGNNPLAISAPTDRAAPFSLDISMSTVSAGKLVLARMRGEPIPEGWALGSDGRPTTDPAAALAKPLLTPFGGHKGFGLAMVVDLLAGILAGAGCGKEVRSFFRDFEHPYNCGFFFLALDIRHFLPLESFTARVAAYIEDIQNSDRLDPNLPIRVPGERSHEERRDRRLYGIPLPEAILQDLNALAARIGIASLQEALEES